jgi:NAD(P)-dependent dehydrogenase (short-subunit alcohol dehydrogenase family)
MNGSLDGKVVLITGGTMGIGLATGLAFGREGAHCTLTYRWGSADEEELRAKFAAAGAPEPHLFQADAANDADTRALLAAMRERHPRVDIFVSPGPAATPIRRFEDYEKRALSWSIDATAWPMFGYLRAMHEVFGAYPRHVVGMSSAGADHFSAHYDFVAGCKSLLETLARYTAARLEGVNVNIVRGGPVLTDSLRAVFGRDFEAFADDAGLRQFVMRPEEIADAVLALCSGLLDGVNGQVLTVDRGMAFAQTSSHRS